MQACLNLRKEEEIMNTDICTYIYDHKNDLLSLLKELVAVRSIKGPAQNGAPFGTGPRAALDKMIGICDKEGFETRLYDDVVGTADLCPDRSFPALGILCHLDVVPADGQEGWNTDPFVMTEKEGILYGRGVIDDKGPLSAAFLALKCIKDLRIPLKKGVRLIFGTDEENGSEDLDIYLKKNRLPENVFTPDAAFPIINIEKGMMRSYFSGKCENGNIVSFQGGSIPNAVPDSAECVITGINKEVIRAAISSDCSGAEFSITDDTGNVRIICTGRSAHASTPENGINAVTALLSLLSSLPLSDGDQKKLINGLCKVFPSGETDGEHAGMKLSDNRSGALTLVFSIFSITDGTASGCIDVRFPVCTSLAEIENSEKAALAEAGCKIVSFMGDEPHITDENSDFVKKLLDVYERCEGTKGECIAIGGGTYVHNIEGGVAFGVERGDTDYHMHGANEWITVDELLKDAVIFAEAITEICGK